MPDPIDDRFGTAASEALRRTPWTLIARAQKGEPGAWERAVERIYLTFSGPVASYLRGKGLREEEAAETAQEFFTRLLERNFVDRLEPSRGRLRHFLFASLRRFVCDEADRRGALKRGGDRRAVSFEDLRHLLGADAPEGNFSRLWAREVLQRAVERMRADCAGTPREPWYLALCRWHEIGAGGGALSYEDLGASLGVGVQQAANYLFRGRALLRGHVLDEIKSYCADAREVRDEVAELFRALGSP